MAPEYVVRGRLSEKADVYSFGVLVVEIVSGKRNSSFVMNSSSILQAVTVINWHASTNSFDAFNKTNVLVVLRPFLG